MLCQTVFGSSANPSRHVPVFDVHDRDMIDALLMFGQQERIGIGIDYIDATALQQRVTVQLRATTVGHVLDSITHRFGYRWSVIGSVVRVTHTGAMVGERNLLNTRIPSFKVSDVPIRLADCNLRVTLYSVLNPTSKGILGDCMYSPESQVGRVEMENAPVWQILDAIVSKGNAAWVVQQPPWTMDKDLGYGLWQVLPYNRTDGKYSSGLQVWGLGLHNR